MLARFNHPAGTTASDETSCKLLCQHPSCWASQRRQEKGVPHKLPPIVSHRSALNETDLPMQSILNLLNEYGTGISDCCPESLGGGCSQHSDTRLLGPNHPVPSASTGCQQRIVQSRERNSSCNPTNEQVSNAHLHVVEIEDPIEIRKFSTGWNEVSVGNSLYVWLPNTKKVPGNCKSRSLEDKTPHRPLMKDVTECMIPEEVGHKRQSNILFADWPTLKKKHAYCRRPAREKTALNLDAVFSGISNPHSGYALHGQLTYLPGKAYSSQTSEASGKLNTGSAELLSEHKENTCGQDILRKPTDSFRRSNFVDDSLLPNRLSRQRSRNALLGGYRRRELTMSSHQTSDTHSKITPILLELPDLSAHPQRPKPFSYGRQDFLFSLGPVPVSLPSYPSRSEQEDYSDELPRVGSGTSATLLVQQTCSNPHADELFHDPGSPAAEMQATFHEAGSLRSSSTPELQPAHKPDNQVVPELGTGTRSDVQWTTARRHAEPEHATVRETSILDDSNVTAESPAPPPPSPEPRV